MAHYKLKRTCRKYEQIAVLKNRLTPPKFFAFNLGPKPPQKYISGLIKFGLNQGIQLKKNKVENARQLILLKYFIKNYLFYYFTLKIIHTFIKTSI